MIKKIMSFFGYVPKKDLINVEKQRDSYKKRFDRYSDTTNAIMLRSGDVGDAVIIRRSSLEFMVGYSLNGYFYPVKSYKDDDDDFARLCAEELCEMLNN